MGGKIRLWRVYLFHEGRRILPIIKRSIQVTWRNADDFLPENFQPNIFIATFTTRSVRLRLYSALELPQERVCYTDTDGVIFHSNAVEPHPQMSDYLGDLTSELDLSEHIVRFVSCGAEQYVSLPIPVVCNISL